MRKAEKEQALHARPDEENLIHHSDHGVQCLRMRYTERLAEAGIELSVGSVGDSYDNEMAETIFGHFKAEVIWPNGPWRCGYGNSCPRKGPKCPREGYSTECLVSAVEKAGLILPVRHGQWGAGPSSRRRSSQALRNC